MTSAYTATYDGWNRLVEIKDGANVVARFECDGLNRRVKSHLDTDETAGVDTYRHFYYNSGWQILETRETDSENGAPDAADPQYQYVWSPRYIDAPVLRDENKDADGDCIDGNDERLYYTGDANMNVTALVETDGTVVERYVYDPYGNCTVYDDDWSDEVTWANSKKNPIRYCGYYFDNETGLCHVRHRSYHPRLGRWMQRDPMQYTDGLGLYEYVGSAPLWESDPTGLASSQGLVQLEATKLSSGGSIELYTNGGDKATVALSPEQSDFWGDLVTTARRIWHGVDAFVNLEEWSTGTSFSAYLTVSVSARRPRRWQICPKYSWRVTVHNICCTSKRVCVHAYVEGGPHAVTRAPTERVIPMDVGTSRELSPHVLLQVILPASTGKREFEAKQFETYALANVYVTCAE